MDVTIAGRLRAAMPRLVNGIRRASGTPDGPRTLLSRVRDVAPPSEVLERLASVRMAAAGSLQPPPPPVLPGTGRAAPERTGSLAGAARTLAADPDVAGDSARSASLGRLARALDLLDATVREQQDLLRRGLRDLR